MLRFVVSRLAQAVPVMFLIATATFFMVRLAPGDPFADEKRIPEEILANLRATYGLDQPLAVQYGRYMRNLLRGDLGPSYKYTGRSVNEIISQSFPVSLELGLEALVLALLLGLPAGLVAALRRNSAWDYLPMATAMAGICLPAFVLGPLLALVFGIWLGWFHPMGWNVASDRVLPALTLGLYYAAYIARLTRAGMIEILSQDFVRTARAKGLPEHVVVLKHALTGGIQPVLSFLGPAIAGLLTGSFIVETVFFVPGLGRFFVNAAFNRDYTLVMGTVLFYAALIIVLNLAVDVVQAWLNPRAREAMG
ncbi:MAG: ABC transporter [Lentisphaerae bacterium RIFOXYB12_FULL_65_16]|nr:MAG: ABC transporter [Lentisphaerae bacterium RIFOXYA12_64_32]OGV85904.1 MAG: ABC transporter [Lentisphaerae bacterium RIFOXYB12_FULL_65_16]